MQHPPTPPTDDGGFLLVEVLLVIIVVSIVLVPLTALIVSTMRLTTDMADRATQASMMASMPAFVSRVTVDACTAPEDYVDALLAQVNVPLDWQASAQVFCTDVPPLVEVVLVTPRGHVEAVLAVVA